MTPSFTSPPDPKIFQHQVWEIARQVPPGLVTTYGQIASMIPPPGTMTPKDYAAFGARWVGGAMSACPPDVPWQRVINSQGKISPRPGAELQHQLLEEEGIRFDERGKIDFDLYGWQGPTADWCKEHGLLTPTALGKSQPKLF
jgi:methylated-DNA-protein-cysteine methyltransferase-like protein